MLMLGRGKGIKNKEVALILDLLTQAERTEKVRVRTTFRVQRINSAHPLTDELSRSAGVRFQIIFFNDWKPVK